MSQILRTAATIVEFAAALVIAVVALLAVLGAVRFIPSAAQEMFNESESAPHVIAMISDLLLAFIAIELLRIAVAYIRRVNVMPTVIEAGLVALIRQVVLFHPKDDVLSAAGGLALLVLSLGILWYLLARSGAMGRHGVEDELATQPAGAGAGADEAVD
jgi:uncharacterized membrane protein (DUF373 family)